MPGPDALTSGAPDAAEIAAKAIAEGKAAEIVEEENDVQEETQDNLKAVFEET